MPKAICRQILKREGFEIFSSLSFLFKCNDRERTEYTQNKRNKNRKVLPKCGGTQMCTRRQKQREFREFEFSLVCLMSSRPTKGYKVRLNPEN